MPKMEVSMLPSSLVTNEIKNAAGVEVEFELQGHGDRTSTYAQKNEPPNQPHRLSIKHAESGAGTSLRRRSVVRFDKTVNGQVDTSKPANIGIYTVADIPIGNLTAMTEPMNVLAELMSFLATTGAATTVLFDCSGHGASTLINGTI